MSLQDLLEEVAGGSPTGGNLVAAERALRVAGRRRARRRAITGLVAAACLALVAVMVTALPDRQHAPAIPADGELAPGQGLPSRIYAVKPWLPTIGSRPTPALAYLLPSVRSDLRMAVAVDGSYWLLPMQPPGPAVAGWEVSSYALSPDGLHLAVAWSQPYATNTPGSRPVAPAHAGIYVYDLAEGTHRGPWLGRGLGGRITDLVWAPKAQGLAWEEFRPSNPGASGGTVAAVAFDWTRGIRRDLNGVSAPLAWSPDGGRIAGQGRNRMLIVSLVAAENPRIASTQPSAGFSLAWSADGRTVAQLTCAEGTGDEPFASTCQDGSASRLDLIDAQTGAVTSHEPAGIASGGEPIPTSLLGWRGGDLILGQTRDDSPEVGYSRFVAELVSARSGQAVGGPVIAGDGLTLNDTPVAATGLLGTAPFVDLPPPTQSALSLAAFSWWFGQHRLAVGGIVLVLLGLSLLWWRGIQRQRRTAADHREQSGYADGTR